MTDDDALLDALRLHLVPGVGPRMMQVLFEAFGSPERALAASETELLSVDGVGPKLARAIRTAGSSCDAVEELERCREAGATLFARGAEEYPHLLSAIPDAPAILYCRGTLLPQDEIAVAIVGSRRCTYYGISQAEKFAGGLARAGITVVSGLAKGIDAAAHRAALAAGGRTIAVTATGLETVYPPEHEKLADEVAAAGAILTEFRLSQKPLAGLFPQRNRVISGLSLGVIVVEASRKSGALHTARHATEQNRDVFAVPGRIDSAASDGCHDLIRDGATLVRGVDDVLEQLGPLLRPVLFPNSSAVRRRSDDPSADSTRTLAPRREVRSVAELSLNDQERRVLDAVSGDPAHIDAVLTASGLEASRVLATLTALEMKRLVRRLPGNLVVRAP
ncbi:MAG: DNA-processing protein DprA [Planctomycetaceae bacterium]